MKKRRFLHGICVLAFAAMLFFGTGQQVFAETGTNNNTANNTSQNTATGTTNQKIKHVAPVKVTGLRTGKWYRDKKRVRVVWDEQNVSGYEFIFMDKNGKELMKGITLRPYYEHSVDNGTFYLIKVRAYSYIDGKKLVSDYSDIVAILEQPLIESYHYGNDFRITIKDGKLSLKWKKTKTAKGYRIYVSKSKDSGYKLVKTINKRNKTSATIKKFGSKKYKAKGTYYIYVQAIKPYGGNICTSGVNYVWEYKKGKIRQKNYFGK